MAKRKLGKLIPIAISARFSSTIQKPCRTKLKLDHVLLLQKLSRLDMERLRNPDLNETQLKEAILERGTDYNALIKHHDINMRFQEQAFQAFEKSGIEYAVANRFGYSESSQERCDAVFTLGGDGTFLLAANKIQNNNMPLIGLNSDPCRSEGHLCIPKEYSANINAALDKLNQGKFRWMFRSRVRVTINGGNQIEPPAELHHQHQSSYFHKEVERNDRKTNKSSYSGEGGVKECAIPILALNEVFLGENVSAKVSYFEVRVNGSEVTRLKSSGMLVCTGTGSTSWNLSTNRLNNQDVEELLDIYSATAACHIDKSLVPAICQQFNDRFIFSPEDSKLGYTVRDLIYAGVWPKPKGRLPARGFAESISIKSRCSDAGLVIDGGIVYPFNDGTTATLRTDPQASLRTVILDQD